jgi:hypothetical protein
VVGTIGPGSRCERDPVGSEFLILGAIPFVLLRVLTRALRRFLPQVRPALRKAAGVVSKVQGGVTRAMDITAAPVIRVHQEAAAAKGFLAALGRLLVVRREDE